MEIDLAALNWEQSSGLIPAIIQDFKSGIVLMLGYMNKEALTKTLSTRKVTFYSRRRQALWVKGETSGNYLNLVNIVADCDQDALLVFANPAGPTCHQNTVSCFDHKQVCDWMTLQTMEVVINSRVKEQVSDSYTVDLVNAGINRIAQKVGEEAVETVVAALQESDARLCDEATDLIYHLVVLLRYRQLSLTDIFTVIRSRMQGTSAKYTCSD